MDGSAIGSVGGQWGLLLGPEPQGDDLRVVDSIPLGSFARSPEMALAGTIKSVRPMLEKAWHERSHTIVGWYRILTSSEDSPAESGREFFLTGGQAHSPRSSVRCCLCLFVRLLRIHRSTCTCAMANSGSRFRNSRCSGSLLRI